MTHSLKALAVATFAALATVGPAMAQIAPPAATAEEVAVRGLLINLTTDDTWAAAKAISFAHQRVLANGHPVAIWMNVRAVYLADTRRASHIPGPMAEAGTSIQDMLSGFMADGGTVLMCAACSGAAGLGLDDYIDGVEMGSWPVVESWLFNPNVTTLSW